MEKQRLQSGFQATTEYKGVLFTVKEQIKVSEAYETYIVNYDGQSKQLRYHRRITEEEQAKYGEARSSINEKVISKEPPGDFIIWPIDTVKIKGYVGYIREQIDKDYGKLLDMIERGGIFSYEQKIRIAMNLIRIYKILLEKKYLYSSLATFIQVHEKTGKLMIEDIIEIEEREKEGGADERFIAPEIVEGEDETVESQRFVLAVLLFLLFCEGHPLEGKKSVVPFISTKLKKELYGKAASFVFDKENEENGPDEILHTDMENKWRELPDYMKELFSRSFSKDGIQNPKKRVTEREWFLALLRFRSDIYFCKHCQRKITVTYEYEFVLDDDCYISGIKGQKLYRWQFEDCESKDAFKVVAQVISKGANSKTLGIRNDSDQVWKALTSKGEEREVEPQNLIPLIPGVQFEVYGKTVQIRERKLIKREK